MADTNKMTAAEIAEAEGEAILEEPNGERPPLSLDAGDDEVLNRASDPARNPDSDPYDERERATR